jgi:hypothetical protein
MKKLSMVLVLIAVCMMFGSMAEAQQLGLPLGRAITPHSHKDALSGGVLNAYVPASKITGTLPLGQMTKHGHLSDTDGGFIALPVVRAYLNTGQTVTCGSLSVINYNQTLVDNLSGFSTGAHTYTPTQAGYYFISVTTSGYGSTTFTQLRTDIRRNGTIFASAPLALTFTPNIPSAQSVQALIYMNGTTDYIDVQGMVSGTGSCYFAGSGSPGKDTGFHAFLISH